MFLESYADLNQYPLTAHSDDHITETAVHSRLLLEQVNDALAGFARQFNCIPGGTTVSYNMDGIWTTQRNNAQVKCDCIGSM